MKARQKELHPIQPFWAFNTSCYQQEVCLRQDISQFYSFKVEEAIDLPAVPDGCIDIVFEYCADGYQAYVYGSVLSHTIWHLEGNREIFGVRFMPGIMPRGLNAFPKDLANKNVHLDTLLSDQSMIEKMAREQDFKKRIKVFLECYNKLENKEAIRYGKMELCKAVRNLILESDGLIKIYEIANITGYTARYINKVFIEYMGFSPKMFCKIIQFQKTLDTFEHDTISNMTELAIKLGYYDQPQFIRDFKNRLGMTPNKYLAMLKEHTQESS